MRKVCWLLVIALFLFSAFFFLRYAALYATLADPRTTQALRQIAALAHLAPHIAGEALGTVQAIKSQADFSLYLSLGLAGLGILCFIVLASTKQPRSRNGYGSNPVCPECGERTDGLAVTCRSCGFRFGPRRR